MNLQVRIPENIAEELNKPTLIEFTAEECLVPHIVKNAAEPQYKDEILRDVEIFLHLPTDTLSQHTIYRTTTKIVISDKVIPVS